jgi:class 3 adenylate cyclase/tetratricopeptide (TPR) repeat protein
MRASAFCPACGAENAGTARFCKSCGTAFRAGSAAAAEARKVVTVVFSDVVESTRLAAALDPEAIRQVMSRYFTEMRPVIESHGGVVEKFIGDAVMAVFGVPRVHEDDALRAVRAAIEMREMLHDLNEELERAWGVELQARTGINTGEVIAADPAQGHSFVAGDAVNTAARLEQAAEPGEILIGESTHRLVEAAVVAESAGSLTLKGKPQPVRAFRLLDVIPGAPGWTRRLDSPLVGRERQIAVLEGAFERSVASGAGELVTVMGVAGVGKSRLTSEFLSGLGDRATVISGRCIPYGEGITFWPIVTVVRDAAGIGGRDGAEEAAPKLARLLEGEPEATLVAERLARLLGIGSATPGIEETFLAVRKLFEHLARRQPLVVVFDDIQWGEMTFLDLLEYLLDRIVTAPVLLLCLTRPELLELRAGWMSGKRGASLLPLQPLTEAEMERLIRNLVGGAELATEARHRVAEVAEGNPLFVEETLRMLVDDGMLAQEGGAWAVAGELSELSIPPTIQALVTARLDRLEPEEQAVIERASVVGRVFWWNAVSELSPSEVRPAIIRHLQSLTRKELVEPDYTETDDDAAFRFSHIVVRDAAYQAIPKAERAELHERLADWMEREAKNVAGDYEELVGYHVEQAVRLRLELAPMNEKAERLARRAAAFLAAGGRRAFAWGDMPAAVKLLGRAASLLPEQGRERAELLPQLAFALFEIGDLATLQTVVDETTETAAASGDSRLAAYATIVGLWIRLSWETEGWADMAEQEATKALAAFEAAADERGLAKASALLGLVHLERAQFRAAEAAYARAADHAREADDRRDELESLAWVPLTVWAGPTPVEPGLERCREVAERAEGDAKVTASVLIAEAALAAGVGRFAEARESAARAKSLLQEFALTQWLGGPVAQLAGWIELLGGNPEAAERELRQGYDMLAEIGEVSWLSTLAAILAEAVSAQGRDAEAAELTQASEASAEAADAYSHALLRSVRAKVLARSGDVNESERLAREAVALADGTDFLHLRWHTRMTEAEVLRLNGHAEQAKPVLEDAIGIAEQKGFLVGADRARGLLEA